MANDELRAAAQKELMRRKAKAELARRKGGVQQSAPAPVEQPQSPFGAPMQPQGMDAAMQKAKGLTFNDVGNFDQALGRMVANGVSYGFANKGQALINNMIQGGGYAENLSQEMEKTNKARETAGTAGTIAEIGGSMLPATKLLQAGATATRLPYIGKYLGMGIDGAALGAATAAGNDQDIGQGAMFGALGGAAGQVAANTISGGVKGINALRNGKTVTPSLDDLRNAKNAAYRQVDDAGVNFAPEQTDQLVSGISDEMAASNLSPIRHPMASSMLNDIKRYSGKSMTLTELDQLRQTVNRDVTYRPDKAEGFFGGKMVDNIDEFTNANGGGELMDNARAANTRYRNTDLVLNKVEKADRRAASSGTGGNADNAIRQNIRSILDNPKQSKFFDPKAKEMMDKLVRGSDEQNLMRSVGRLSPETGGLQAAISTMGSIAHPAIGIPAATGFVAKRLADRKTKKSVDELLHYLSTGTQKPVPKAMSSSNKELIARLIMGGTIGASQ